MSVKKESDEKYKCDINYTTSHFKNSNMAVVMLHGSIVYKH